VDSHKIDKAAALGRSSPGDDFQGQVILFTVQSLWKTTGALSPVNLRPFDEKLWDVSYDRDDNNQLRKHPVELATTVEWFHMRQRSRAGQAPEAGKKLEPLIQRKIHHRLCLKSAAPTGKKIFDRSSIL
jgi:hypothetical protein